MCTGTDHDLELLRQESLIEKAINRLLLAEDSELLLKILDDSIYEYALKHRFPSRVLADCKRSSGDIDVLKQLFKPAVRNGVIELFSMTNHTTDQTFVFESGHPCISLVYAISGDLHCWTSGQDFVLREGESCISSSFLSFESYSEDQGIAIMCLMHERYFTDILLNRLPKGNLFNRIFSGNILEHSISGNILQIDTKDSSRLRFFMTNVFREYVDSYFQFDEIINSYILLIFSELLSNYSEDFADISGDEAGSAQLKDITDYMQDHLATVTLGDVAEHFHYSPSYLSGLIKRLSGSTFTELIRDTRLNRASVMLQYSNISISEIIRELGYSNTSFFYNLFQRRFGCTPSEYRARGGISNSRK